MAGVTIKIEGLDKALNRLDINKYKNEIKSAFFDYGVSASAEAKELAPVDEGRLRSAIYYNLKELGVVIGCTVDYAAYLEFGTRRFAAEYVAQLPATWQELAAKFKGGGGGSFDEFVIVLFEWVKKKNIRLEPKRSEQGDDYRFGILKKNKRVKKQTIEQGQQQLAYIIALKILREGIKPQPFLYPAITGRLYDKLIEDLKTIPDRIK